MILAPQLDNVAPYDGEWDPIAPIQQERDKIADKFLNLPIAEFRSFPYTPPALPADVPKIDIDVQISELTIAVRDGTKIALRVYRSAHHQPNSSLFFNAHGGGWVVGTPQTEEAQNRIIAVETNALVVSVDYRRAPEFPFPYAVNDSYDALLWCKSNAAEIGFDPNSIILGGGSAGANICAVMAQLCRDNGVKGIIGQILNIPVICHPTHFPKSKYKYTSFEENKDSPVVGASRMLWFWDQYYPQAEADPKANPLLASSLEGLPPTLIQVAEKDPLRDEGLAYAERLRDSGVSVSVKIYPGLPHAFYIHTSLPQTKEYFQTMVDWISKTLSLHSKVELKDWRQTGRQLFY